MNEHSKIGWDELVDVPPEEPQDGPQEPWQLYMTDRGCKAAVEAYSAKHGVPLADAARQVAKTVVPAPHNFVAATARYLLAPEAEEFDDQEFDQRMAMFDAETVDEFTETAQRQAEWDGPESPEGHRYSEGLTNRAGEVPPGVTEPVPDGVVLVAQRPGAAYSVPPSVDEVAPDQVVRVSNTQHMVGTDPTMWFSDYNVDAWQRMQDQIEAELNEKDLIPVGAPTLDFKIVTTPLFPGDDRAQVWCSEARMEFTCVPRVGREFDLKMIYAEPDDNDIAEENLSELGSSCYLADSRNYGRYATVIYWAKHAHEAGVTVLGLGDSAGVLGLDGSPAEDLLAELLARIAARGRT